MRKLLFICAAILGVAVAAGSATVVTGDVTGDGQVDIADVNAVINVMLGKIDTSDELQAASDVTGDGQVDIADVNAVINIMLGKVQPGDVFARLEADMVTVEGGTFDMGTADGVAPYSHAWERPVHSVTLPAFKVCRYEVTQDLWQAVMSSNPSAFEGERRPVEMVSWADAQAFVQKLVEKTGKPMCTWESKDCWSIYPLVNQHGGDWLTPDNEVRMDEQVVIDTLAFMKSMLDDGTAVACPGGNHHSEEYYGWMNGGNCASVSMPFWYLNRFTDYMPDLAGKMKVAPMPLWPDGGHKSAQMGGTGTAVVKTSPNVDIAKEWLAYATLSFEGSVNTWLILGFDPIMTDVYGSEEMKAPNKFFDYYEDDTIFDMLKTILDDIPDTCLTEYFPAAADIVRNQMAYDLVIGGGDPAEIAHNCAEELRDQIM